MNKKLPNCALKRSRNWYENAPAAASFSLIFTGEAFLFVC